jgi:N-acetylmuramoyl-L-alanine amidase
VIATRTAPCPHHRARTQPVRLIVVHADASPRESSTISWLANPASQVSYHVLIHRDGTTTRFVADDRTAWHAGRSQWQGVSGVNGISLGLAFANRQDGKEAITPAQYSTARAWVSYWRRHHGAVAVVTHADVSPGRKSDPHRAPNWAITEVTG